jgi:multidrug efflux pump subunit AcrA (membrane-fusion protein)
MAARTGSTIPDLSALRIDEGARKPRGGPKWPRWVTVAVGLLLLISAAVYALRGRAPLVEVAATQAPSAGGEVALLNASGYVTPRRRATVAAKITARVTQMYADEGMRVKEGQVLALLDDSDYRVRLNSAKADRDATAAQLQDLQVQLANTESEIHRTQQQNCSRAMMAEAAMDEKLGTLLRLHEEAFRQLRGVPREILYGSSR